jgi:hypothetical protein
LKAQETYTLGHPKFLGVPLKQRPVLIARDHRRTLKARGGDAEDGGPLYLNQELPDSAVLSGERNPTTMRVASGVVALHLDFVAKPNGARELNRELGSVLKKAGLAQEGLETGLLLVSDREARLVTLLTFWDAERFQSGRERRIGWMQKLLVPFADGPVRAQISTPRFVLAESAVGFGLEKPSTRKVVELAQAAG